MPQFLVRYKITTNHSCLVEAETEQEAITKFECYEDVTFEKEHGMESIVVTDVKETQ